MGNYNFMKTKVHTRLLPVRIYCDYNLIFLAKIYASPWYSCPTLQCEMFVRKRKNKYTKTMPVTCVFIVHFDLISDDASFKKLVYQDNFLVIFFILVEDYVIPVMAAILVFVGFYLIELIILVLAWRRYVFTCLA